MYCNVEYINRIYLEEFDTKKERDKYVDKIMNSTGYEDFRACAITKSQAKADNYLSNFIKD